MNRVRVPVRGEPSTSVSTGTERGDAKVTINAGKTEPRRPSARRKLTPSNIGIVVALGSSSVALIFTLWPGLAPDPRVNYAADVSVFSVDHGVTCDEYLHRIAFTANDLARARARRICTLTNVAGEVVLSARPSKASSGAQSCFAGRSTIGEPGSESRASARFRSRRSTSRLLAIGQPGDLDTAAALWGAKTQSPRYCRRIVLGCVGRVPRLDASQWRSATCRSKVCARRIGADGGRNRRSQSPPGACRAQAAGPKMIHPQPDVENGGADKHRSLRRERRS
jgi:hypothetical protein